MDSKATDTERALRSENAALRKQLAESQEWVKRMTETDIMRCYHYSVLKEELDSIKRQVHVCKNGRVIRSLPLRAKG